MVADCSWSCIERYRCTNLSVQYVRDEMGTHFDPNCKHFYQNSHFIEFPFYREKIAMLFNCFRFPFPEKQAFWSRNPCCLTSFLSKYSHFRESLAICRLNSHFIEFPFYREKIAAYFGENVIHFPILSNSLYRERTVPCQEKKNWNKNINFSWRDINFKITKIMENSLKFS